MKKAFFAVILLSLSFSAVAQVQHDIRVDKSSVKVNTSILLECSEDNKNCPVNSWKLRWEIPENADIIYMNDTNGPIEDYSREENQLVIETNTGPKRTSEKVEIGWKEEGESEEIVEGLYSKKIPLLSLRNKAISGSITGDKLLSISLPSEFEKGITENLTQFKGVNGTAATVYIGEGQKESIYEFFGGKIKNSSLAYRISLAATNRRPNFRTIPVAVYSQEEYVSQVSGWSAGEYVSGAIRIQNSSRKHKAPILAEETSHAINDAALRFDKTSSSWLDEGISGYVQTLTIKALEGRSRVPELFGENVSFTREENGSLYRYIRGSKGKKKDLWNYYQTNRSFMKDWTPRKTENREFGYAYSELVIRNYISHNNSLKELYSQIGGKKLRNNEEKWRFYSNYLNLTPCKYGSREKFNRCLERVNSYDYPVLIADSIPEDPEKKLKVQELEIEEVEPGIYWKMKNAVKNLLEKLGNLF